MSKILILFQIGLISLVSAHSQNANAYQRVRCRIEQAQATPSTSCLLQSQPVAQRDDYTYTSGLSGYKVHTRALTWAKARRTCEEEGGHLAIINSIAESNVLTDLFKNSGTPIGGVGDPNWAHIGFHDLFEEGEYLTIHSQTLAKAGFTQWAPGQPDNAHGGEHCGCIYKNGGLADIVCSSVQPFICEIPHYSQSANGNHSVISVV